MSVAGLKKQFYKASQVSGGRGEGSEPRALGCPELGTRPGPTLAREGAAGTEGAALARVPRWVGRAQEGRGFAHEVAQALPAMWAPVSPRRVGRPLGGTGMHPEVDPGQGPLPSLPPL